MPDLDYEQNKDKQVEQLIQIIKIASLSLPMVAFLVYYFKEAVVFNFTIYLSIYVISIILLVVTLLWIVLRVKFKTVRKVLDPIISMVLASIAIYLTDSYQSNFKFLFLFVIISSSIEYSKKTSLAIAGISALLVLGIDLVFAPQSPVNIYFESDLILGGIFMLVAWMLGLYVNLEKKHIEKLKEMTKIDGLTGLYNHRHFYDIIKAKIKEYDSDAKPAHLTKGQLSLLFLDIDFFKNYNDLYGHQKGDEILQTVSCILKETAREGDIITRYGGDEFAIILPETGKREAVKIAEEIRSKVQEAYFFGQENMPGQNLTVSVGVSVYPTQAKTEIDLIKYADDALYRAKFLWRNKVEAYFSLLEDLQIDADEKEKETLASIKTLIAVINSRDNYTYRHTERVVLYCILVAEKLGFDEHTRKILIQAAYIHDIGKINIPKEVLIKSKPLTDDEWKSLREHPQNAVDIIKNVSLLEEVVPIILQHHERYDGTGYPQGLKGEEIHYLARLLAVIDSFDAMTSNRPYQKRLSYTKAIEEIKLNSGTQFDPDLARDFIRIINENFIR